MLVFAHWLSRCVLGRETNRGDTAVDNQVQEPDSDGPLRESVPSSTTPRPLSASLVHPRGGKELRRSCGLRLWMEGKEKMKERIGRLRLQDA